MTDPAGSRVADLIRSPFAAQLVAAMPEAALIVGADGRVAAANNPALNLLAALKLGDPLVLALRAPDVVDAYRRVIASGEGETVQWSERVPVERLFDVSVAPLSSPAGEVEAVLVTLRDLTEIRRVERLRVDFIANASHELRTPLASLLGFIETLQGSARDDAKARDRFLAIMRDQGRRMARLIEDLLSLSRIEQKQHLRPETVVDLAQSVRSVVDSLSPMAEELGAEIRFSAPEPVLVNGDRDELVRVAENLIENAIKYGVRLDADASPGRGHGVFDREGGAADGARLRSRHPAGAPAAPDRALLSRRRHPEPGAQRHGARPRYRQAHSHPPPRQAEHHEPDQSRLDFRRERAASRQAQITGGPAEGRSKGALAIAGWVRREPARNQRVGSRCSSGADLIISMR